MCHFSHNLITEIGDVYVPTPSTCTICCDILLDYEDDTLTGLIPIVATKCGHLFHTACINGWFKSSISGDQQLKQCPYCTRNMRRCDLRRIFTKNVGHILRNGGDKKYRPAPSKCLVCYNYMLEHVFQDGEHSSPSLRAIVATKCGHLFHTSCLNIWFKNNNTEDPEIKSCPDCCRKMRRCDVRRVFPVTSGEE